MNKFMEDWSKELDDLDITISLGEEEYVEAFEKQKAKLSHFIEDMTSSLENSELGEKTQPLRTKLDELKVQLALGRAETQDAFETQRKNLETKLHEANSAYEKLQERGEQKTGEWARAFKDRAEGFKTRLDLLRLHFSLGVADAHDELESLRSELKDKISGMKKKIEVKGEEAEDKWDEISEELGEAYEHFKGALKRVFS
ncbi:MAG: hypothetical protein D6722_01985 [Bacteroidetes bacterium]|nr:MAG: hypothetical protein D6722_01985 [Bacteroidota bacterium]